MQNTIRSAGETVQPEEVEAVLLQHPLIAAAAVVGIAHPRWGEQVCTDKEPGGSSVQAVRGWLPGRVCFDCGDSSRLLAIAQGHGAAPMSDMQMKWCRRCSGRHLLALGGISPGREASVCRDATAVRGFCVRSCMRQYMSYWHGIDSWARRCALCCSWRWGPAGMSWHHHLSWAAEKAQNTCKDLDHMQQR